MSITSGFKKTKRYRKLSNGNYQLQSEWTSASTVEMADGKTVETAMTTHDTQNNVTTFTSDDSTTSLSSTPPALITSGETHKSLFNKISTAVKNVRWLLSKMGTTDLSGIGDGTVTNAISTLNSNNIKITILSGTTAYLSANAAALDINHSLGDRIVCAIPITHNSSALKGFPYSLSCTWSSKKVHVGLYSKSSWSSDNASVDVKLIVFYK